MHMMNQDWTFGDVEKRGGVWGFFETHTPTGMSRFVSWGLRTKRETVEHQMRYIASGRKK